MDDNANANKAPGDKPDPKNKRLKPVPAYYYGQMTERSIKFYDGTYQLDGPRGFWDDKDVYHTFGDPDDEDAEAPTPPPIMPLDYEFDEDATYEGDETMQQRLAIREPSPMIPLDDDEAGDQANEAMQLSGDTTRDGIWKSGLLTEWKSGISQKRRDSKGDEINPRPSIEPSASLQFSYTAMPPITDKAAPQIEPPATHSDRDRLSAELEGISIGTKRGFSQAKRTGLKQVQRPSVSPIDDFVPLKLTTQMTEPQSTFGDAHSGERREDDDHKASEYGDKSSAAAGLPDVGPLETTLPGGTSNLPKPTTVLQHDDKNLTNMSPPDHSKSDADADDTSLSLSDVPSDLSNWAVDNKVRSILPFYPSLSDLPLAAI